LPKLMGAATRAFDDLVVSISVVLRLSVTYVCALLSGCVVAAGGDFIPSILCGPHQIE
jgi:hypothetical protein